MNLGIILRHIDSNRFNRCKVKSVTPGVTPADSLVKKFHVKITDQQARHLKPQAKRFEVMEGNGFGLRVFPTGRKSWVFFYRFDGRLRRMTLGTYPAMSVKQAHAAHGKALADLDRGIDPGAVAVTTRRETRLAATVAALAEEYLEKWAKPRKRSWAEDARILKLDVLPAWGRRKARDITRRDVILLLDGIVERGAPIAANRTLEITRKMFNFAIARDLLSENPCSLVDPPGEERQRTRRCEPGRGRSSFRPTCCRLRAA